MRSKIIKIFVKRPGEVEAVEVGGVDPDSDRESRLRKLRKLIPIAIGSCGK